MSLVAYGSSDEESENEESTPVAVNAEENEVKSVTEHVNTKLCLPQPKRHVHALEENDRSSEEIDTEEVKERIHFDALPKPKSTSEESIVEDDNIPPKKEVMPQVERIVKKDRAPVRITVPSLSDFKDVEEESKKKQHKVEPSKKECGLFVLLPPPKTAVVQSTTSLTPRVLSKPPQTTQKQPQTTVKDAVVKVVKSNKSVVAKIDSSLGGLDYDSNSDDEETVNTNSASTNIDFFSLTTEAPALDNAEDYDALTETIELVKRDISIRKTSVQNNSLGGDDSSRRLNEASQISTKTLVSNVMNLPKEEIVLKNKAEVGPKLPVPEQEYNIDHEGNVAFDEKAIEYLCGKRGVKRKNQVMDDANIIEINGEDIKPDEREWLVKALTEEPAERPMSMQSSGVNSQSKKKHQITYLAHQAKAMEVELKNQWAQNRMTRKQTQSKYGF